ncbi:hypothetical protein [Rhizobium tropici]|uniref:hypothetical protein n=1 Tax=Rhizobium tropici TaxID=398 RepID=UPI00165ED29D|nr:hypothetical protein [Rhizobium tropici]
MSIILQTRSALFAASSAAIAELATTNAVVTAKNSLIENPDPLWRHGARACFFLQDMLHGFAVTVWKYNVNDDNLFAGELDYPALLEIFGRNRGTLTSLEPLPAASSVDP